MAQSSAGPLGETTIRTFVAELSSAAPVPGGGAAAAVIGATAAGLLAMVAELSHGRPKLVVYGPTHKRGIAAGHRMRDELLRLGDWDNEAFGVFLGVWRDSRGLAPDDRRAAVSPAARAAAEAPRRMVACCVVVADAVEALAGRCNPDLASDLMCASRAVEAAVHCAAENVYVNVAQMEDHVAAEEIRREVRAQVFAVERNVRRCQRVTALGKLRQPERRGGAKTTGADEAPAEG
jgi:methenyltetrahydrofolate cyclohydrolase